jgi:hypothetical protein
MDNYSSLHTMTHVVINDLQKAFLACHDRPTEGHILSAIVTVKQVHDFITHPESAMADVDPEEYCAAV